MLMLSFDTLLSTFNNVFTIGSLFHLVFVFVSILLLILIIINKKFILKYYKYVMGILLLVCLIPELMVYYDSLVDQNYLRIIPLGMCHLSVYLTTFIVFKYNRKIHILTILLAAGGLLSIIAPAPIEGLTLDRIRPYYFYLIHFYIIAANIILMHKHNTVLNFNDYLYGITRIFIFIAIFIFASIFTKNDELFFFTGPEGIFLENVTFGPFRAFVAITVYFLVYSLPYFMYIQVRNIVKSKNKVTSK